MQVPRLWLFEPIQQQASHVPPLPFQDRAQPLPSPLIVAKSLDLRASPQNRRAFGSAASHQGTSPGTQVVARPSHDRRQEHAPRPKENPRARQQEKTARRPTAICRPACSFKNIVCEQTNVVTLITNDVCCRMSHAHLRCTSLGELQVFWSEANHESATV